MTGALSRGGRRGQALRRRGVPWQGGERSPQTHWFDRTFGRSPPKHQATKIPSEPNHLDPLARVIVDAALKVHRELGPGLIGSVYEHCLAYEIDKSGYRVSRQGPVPIIYEGVRLDADLRLDLLVEGSIIIEVKAVEQELPVFRAQLLTYMKLTGKRLGFLMNFNVPLIKDGIRRLAL